MPGNAVQAAVIRCRINPPVPTAADVGDSWAEPVAQKPEQTEHNVRVSAGIGHDLGGMELCLLFEDHFDLNAIRSHSSTI